MKGQKTVKSGAAHRIIWECIEGESLPNMERTHNY